MVNVQWEENTEIELVQHRKNQCANAEAENQRCFFIYHLFQYISGVRISEASSGIVLFVIPKTIKEKAKKKKVT